MGFATPLETYAQACYPRSREEPAPRPGNPTPKRGKAPGIRRGVPCGCPVAVKTRLSDPVRPPVLLCHAAPLLCPNNPRRHYRFARDRRHLQLGGAQNVAETNRLLAFAGTTVLAVPGNLKQAPGERSSSPPTPSPSVLRLLRGRYGPMTTHAAEPDHRTFTSRSRHVHRNERVQGSRHAAHQA